MPASEADSPDEEAMRADLACFFAANGQAYLQFYEKRRWHRAAGRRWPLPSWSWPAFGAWSAWFWYRKMRPMGLLVLLLPSFASLLLGESAALIVYLATAVFAKEIYLATALKAIAAADDKGLANEARRAFLRSLGGTSMLSGAFGVLLVTLMTALSLLDALPDIVDQLDSMGLLPPS
jgi:hypothetical protein